MEIVPVSDFPAASSLTGSEIVPVVQSGVTKRTTAAALAALAAADDSALYPRFQISWLAAPFTTTLESDGFSNFTSSNFGTPAAQDPVPATSFRTSTQRVRDVSGAFADTNAGYYQVGTRSGSYRAVSGAAGKIDTRLEMIVAYHVVASDQRAFVGFVDSVSPGVSQPSAFLNCAGYGKDSADVNLFLMHNDGSGACTKVDTGVTFASLIDKLLRVRIRFMPTSGAVAIQIANMETGATIHSATLTLNIPDADTRLWWAAFANTAANATAVQTELSRVTLSTVCGYSV